LTAAIASGRDSANSIVPDEEIVVSYLYVTDREEWRSWLDKNHSTEKEIWIIYYKKHTGEPRIPYDDAVEEALCFGWIAEAIRLLNDGQKLGMK